MTTFITLTAKDISEKNACPAGIKRFKRLGATRFVWTALAQWLVMNDQDLKSDFNWLVDNKLLPLFNFDKENFSDSTIKLVDFRRVSLEGALFLESFINETKFDYCCANQSNFKNAKVYNSSFWMTPLQGSILAFATFDNCNFNQVDLWRSYLTDSTFINCNFTGADLRYAILLNAKFNKCTFENTNLRGLNLCDLDFSSCWSFDKAFLEGAKYNKNTKFPKGFPAKIKKTMELVNTTK